MGIRLEVLEFLDSTNRSLLQRIPPEGVADIEPGAQLIVGENQSAVLFRDGKAHDTFGPGRHTLSARNSPFPAQIYFVGRQTFVDQKWGTRQPITVRDADFGILRLRSFGKFAFRVVDAAKLVAALVGERGLLTTDDVNSHLKERIVERLTDVLSSAGIAMFDLPAKFEEVTSATREKLSGDFATYGLELVDFFINAITPPEEVRKTIDARSRIVPIGDLHAFTLYQTLAGFSTPSTVRQAAIQTAQQAAQPPVGSADGLGVATVFSKAEGQGDPRKMIRQVAENAGWTVVAAGARLQVTVPIGSLRKQTVEVDLSGDDGAGHAIWAFTSTCGPASERDALQLLKCNTRLVHGAFAVRSTPAGDMVVVQANELADTATPLDVARILAAVAWQADQAEEQWTGQDRN